MSLLRSRWHEVKSALTAAKLGVKLIREEIEQNHRVLHGTELSNVVFQVENRLDKCVAELKMLEEDIKSRQTV